MGRTFRECIIGVLFGMKLKQLIDTLIHGNLYQFNVAKNEQFPAIINAANQELIQLYSRFPILEKDVAFRRFPEISMYHLTRKYCRSNDESKELYKYILDTKDNPFLGDILKIENAYTESGQHIVLNDNNNPRAWFTPSFDTIQIPNTTDVDTRIAVIGYKAKPEYIDPDTNNFEQDIYIPSCLEEPLVYGITLRIAQRLPTQTAAQVVQVAQAKYKELCDNVDTFNLFHENTVSTNVKLGMRKFV